MIEQEMQVRRNFQDSYIDVDVWRKDVVSHNESLCS